MEEDILEHDETDAANGITKPHPKTVVELGDEWRWLSEASDEWNLVANEEHARLLINSVDETWPWLIIERDHGENLVYVKVTSCEWGLCIEINSSHPTISRLFKITDTFPLAFPEESNFTGKTNTLLDSISDSEVFSIHVADEICLEWLKAKRLPSNVGLRPIRKYV